MGNPISKVREETEAADERTKQQMQERLNILDKMLHAHLENEMHRILNGERNDQQIHSGTVVELRKKAYITESEKESQEIRKVIGDFFHGKWIDGLEKMVQIGADSVLGNTRMGEFETSDMIIVWNSNALLRCDTYYYRWNFTSQGVVDKHEGILGVILIKRVIDMTKTDPQVLTWAITQQANRQPNSNPEEAEKEVEFATKALKKVVAFQAELRQLESGKLALDDEQ